MKMPARREFFAKLGAIGGCSHLRHRRKRKLQRRAASSRQISRKVTLIRRSADDTKGVTEFFKGDDLKAVDRENVIRLIPRLKAI